MRILTYPQQWRCDECGGLIERVEEGWLEWRHEWPNDPRLYGFRIVHHFSASPYGPHGTCYAAQRLPGRPLSFFIGPEGLDKLLTILEDQRVRELAGFAEVIRRLHLPGHEERRATV